MNNFASEVNFLRENIAGTFFFADRGKTEKTVEPVKILYRMVYVAQVFVLSGVNDHCMFSVFNTNISFTFQVIKNLSLHPTYLRFGLFL